MYSLVLKEVEDLINIIKFPSLKEPSSANDNRGMQLYFESLFKDFLLRYLRGTGHPDVPGVREQITDDEFVSRTADKLFRAQLFMRVASGSELVKTDPSWGISVRCSNKAANMKF